MGANTIFSPARLLSSAWQPVISWNGPNSMASCTAPCGSLLRPPQQSERCLLVIDVQGAAQHRNAGLDAVFVFVLPPSWEALAERLQARGSESASTQAQRLLVARQELAHYTAYDYVVINDQLDDAVETLQAIIVAERQRIRRVGTVPIAPLLAPQQTKG